MNSLLALYIANAKEFLRDRVAMFFTILLPIAFALFFGSVFGNTQNYKLGLGLAVEDAGPGGKEFAARLNSYEARQTLALQQGTREDLLNSLGQGKLDVVLVIPADFSSAIGGGKTAPVELYYDPARQASASTGRGIARTILAEASLAISGVKPLLVPDEREVQAKPLRAADFFVPNLLGMAMLWLGLFSTAQPLAELREQQVLRRIGATPLSRGKLLSGQVAWRVTIGLIQAALFLLVGRFAMGVQINGNWPLFVLAVILGALVFVSMGYLVAGITKSVESTVAIAQIINFPMMFLSGTFFEASFMPAFFQPIIQAMPLTYLNDALRQLMVGYPPSYALGTDFAVLGAWLVAMVGLSLKFFRWE